MPKFRVLRRRDAFADYIATVEADTPEEAADMANGAPWEYEWEPDGVVEFDASLFVTLDADGEEIDGTACGKAA